MQNLVVYKHHGLVESNFSLNIDEFRLFNLILGKLDQRIRLNPDEDYIINISDYAARYEISEKEAYEDIKKAIISITEQTFTIEAIKLKELNSFNLGNAEIIKSNFLSHVGWSDKRKEIIVRFSPLICRMVSDLSSKNGYLKFDLKNHLGVSSVYAARLYELLKKWEKKGEARYKIEEIFEYLQLSNGYRAYKNLKGKVLLPAMKVISEKTDIIVEIKEEVKVGKGVDIVVFRVEGKGLENFLI